jgi:hypothetical protein
MKRLALAALIGFWCGRRRSGFYMVGTVDPKDLPPGKWTPVFGRPDECILSGHGYPKHRAHYL